MFTFSSINLLIDAIPAPFRSAPTRAMRDLQEERRCRSLVLNYRKKGANDDRDPPPRRDLDCRRGRLLRRLMRTVLGIDAAWTGTQPSGVALAVENERGGRVKAG